MELDNQTQIKKVRAIVVVNGKVSMAAARRNGDEVGMSHQIGPAVDQVYPEWPERYSVHGTPDLFDRCHGQPLPYSDSLAPAP